MSLTAFSASTVEDAALTSLEALGRTVKHSLEIAPDGLFAERQDYRQVVLPQRLRDALLPMLGRPAGRPYPSAGRSG